MALMGLTEKQQKLKAFIVKYMADRGNVAPSFDEMRIEMEVSSNAAIHRLLKSLEDRGHIRRLKARVRAIEILEG